MSQVSARFHPSAWIISPPWDLACIIATPLAILPVFLLLTRGGFTTEQISLFVLAFASVGHHMPGFLRAYGERELFARFRWRFLLAPPLVLAATLTFVWQQLHGLQVILLFWATWHILMQTYGFLRIYGLKQGESSRLAAHFDWLVCVAIFVAGYVFSDNRVYTLADVLSQTGLPTLGAQELFIARLTVGVVAGAIGVAYVARLIAGGFSGRGVSVAKVLLIASTATFYWLSGLVTTDLLLGVAMFEIFHAVQYYAITWSYERRRWQRKAPEAGWLAPWLSRYGLHAAVCAAVVAAFGGVRYALGTPIDGWLLKVVTAVYAASALLHFYYDGFIWKVSERSTQANLDIALPSPPPRASLPGLLHGAKWAALVGAAALLVLLECRSTTTNRTAVALQLASLLPNVPEAQARAHHEALLSGDVAAAIAMARREVALRPQASAAHADLGTALLADRQYTAAAAALRESVRLDATVWQNHFDLAQCDTALGLWNQAGQSFSEAAALEPKNAHIPAAWAAMCARRGDTRGAVEHFRLAQSLAPGAMVVRGDLAAANLHQGQALQQAGNLPQAAASYRECLAWAPDSADANLKLGEVLSGEGELAAAAIAYTQVLELQPNHAAAHYNLGLIKWEQGDATAARRLILRARELGLEPSPEVAHELKL